MANRLFIFTGTFPYAFRESFLEQELPYLAKEFEKVIIIPLGGAGTKMREVPTGVFVDSRLHCSRRKKILIGFLNLWRVFPLYYIDLFKSGAIIDVKKFKIWTKSTLLTSFYLASSPIREIQATVSKDDILYYYWGVDYNNIAPFLKGKCVQVSRFHGDWDLWRNGGDDEAYSPCRQQLMQSLDCAVTISERGRLFLTSRYPNLRVKTFRLGTLDLGAGRKSSDNCLRVLSCSSVYQLKRVDYIYDCLHALSKKGKRIIWTHIGNGPLFDDLKAKCDNSCPESLKINLVGRLPHDEVLKYYMENEVDLFINLSTNEGIPVSVMEAISFNVPVVATYVGATREIVTEETGCLVQASPSVEEVVAAINNVVTNNYKPRDYWNQHYNAEKNYGKFAKFIKSLQ